MLNELYKAIRTHYLASSLADKLTDLYLTEAPAESVFPYGVLQLVSGITDDFASGGHFSENCLVQFSIYDDKPTAERLLAAYTALMDSFDFAALSITGYDTLSCVREGSLQTRVENVWQITVTYRIKVRL